MKTIIILLLSLSYLPCAVTARAQGAAGKPLDLASTPASALKLQAAGVIGIIGTLAFAETVEERYAG